MKIKDVIKHTIQLVPSQYTEDVFMRWLSDLDGKVYNDLMVGLEECPETAPGVYTDVDTELLIPYPYEDLYINYLCAKIHQQNADYDRYTNSMIEYNNAYSNYAAMYVRTHRITGTADMQYYETEDTTADW